MNQDPATFASGFFVAGGTLRADTPSYVKRVADDELFNRTINGEFCYILTPRQMGKSSLMIRTAQRLQAKGIQTVIIDLTSIGTVEVEQWYLGILTNLAKRLKLKTNLISWWNERQSLGLVQRFMDFIREVVLTEIQDRVVIFIDEIDSTLKLDFRDDFFAAIRALYNARAADPEFNRISFVLLGVASPSDLIKNRSRTPFNIGVEIPLYRFGREDARSLEAGLNLTYPGQGAAILDYIFHWTAGHPYLTQKLCHEIVEKRLSTCSQTQVDQFVQDLFLSKEARRETNLQFVRDTLLSHPQKRQLLALYARVHRGKKIIDDKQSVLQNQLKLSGLVIAQEGSLRVHNELYRKAFSLTWVRMNTPVNWVPYVAVITTLIAITLAVIFGYNSWLGGRATNAERCYYNPRQGETRLQCLAFFFRMRPLLVQNNYPRQGRNLFFTTRTGCEQLNLFPSSIPSSSCPPSAPARVSTQDLIDVVEGLHVTLADTDGSGSTTVLLQAMLQELQRADQTNESVKRFSSEIELWLQARQALQNKLYATAEAKYRLAIESYSTNPATHYELAKTLSLLSETDTQNQTRYSQEALTLLDQAIALGKTMGKLDTEDESSQVEPTNTATSTPSKYEQISPLSTSGTRQVTPPLATKGTSEASTQVTLATPLVTPTPTSTSSPSISSQAIDPNFASVYEIAQAVSRLIENNPGLLSTLKATLLQTYPNLAAYTSLQEVTYTSRIPATSLSTPSIPSTPTPGISDMLFTLENGCDRTYSPGSEQVFTYLPNQDGMVTFELDGELLSEDNPKIVLGGTQYSGNILIPGQPGVHILSARFDLDKFSITRECRFTVAQEITPSPVSEVNLWIDPGGCGSQYNVGDPITIHVLANQDGQVDFSIQPAGGITNTWLSIGDVSTVGVTAGQEAVLGWQSPSDSGAWMLRASLNNGTATVTCDLNVIEKNPPSIQSIELVPQLPCNDQNVTAVVKVWDDSGIDSVQLFARPAGSVDFSEMPGIRVDNFTFQYRLYAPKDGGSEFYVIVQDIFGNTTSTQPLPNQAYSGFTESGIDYEPYCTAFLVMPQIDLYGMDLYSLTAVKSAYECLTLCTDNLTCQAFTYDADNTGCWLKNGVPALVPKDVCTSGIKYHVPIPP